MFRSTHHPSSATDICPSSSIQICLVWPSTVDPAASHRPTSTPSQSPLDLLLTHMRPADAHADSTPFSWQRHSTLPRNILRRREGHHRALRLRLLAQELRRRADPPVADGGDPSWGASLPLLSSLNLIGAWKLTIPRSSIRRPRPLPRPSSRASSASLSKVNAPPAPSHPRSRIPTSTTSRSISHESRRSVVPLCL